MAARSPEVGDGRADRRVLLGCKFVNVARISDLALSRRVDAVDLARSQVLEVREPKLLGQCVHLGVLEELVARHIHIRNRGVLLQRPLAGRLLREVIARVEKLKEAADSVDIFAGELNVARLRCETRTGSVDGPLQQGAEGVWAYAAIMRELSALLSEVGALTKQPLMGR